MCCCCCYQLPCSLAQTNLHLGLTHPGVSTVVYFLWQYDLASLAWFAGRTVLRHPTGCSDVTFVPAPLDGWPDVIVRSLSLSLSGGVPVSLVPALHVACILASCLSDIGWTCVCVWVRTFVRACVRVWGGGDLQAARPGLPHYCDLVGCGCPCSQGIPACHDLPLAVMRPTGVLRSHRSCPCWSLQDVGDESYLLISCPAL